MGADRTWELDGRLLDGAGARYEGAGLGEGRDRTAGREPDRDEDPTDGRENDRWDVGLDARDLEAEGLDRLRLVRLVKDPPDLDEGRDRLRLDGVDRVDCGTRFGVRLKLGPDRPLDREPGRWRVKVPVDPVPSGRVTNDGREGVRTRDFPGFVTEGLDGLRSVRRVTDPLDPEEGRERLRLGAVERVDCRARVGVRTTFTPDRPLDRESGRCRTNDRVDPVRSERLTADRREGPPEPPEPLLATLERREPRSTTRSRVRSVAPEASLEERTALLEVTAFGPRPRGRRSSPGSPSRKLPTMELEATTRVLAGPLPRSRP